MAVIWYILICFWNPSKEHRREKDDELDIKLNIYFCIFCIFLHIFAYFAYFCNIMANIARDNNNRFEESFLNFPNV